VLRLGQAEAIALARAMACGPSPTAADQAQAPAAAPWRWIGWHSRPQEPIKILLGDGMAALLPRGKWGSFVKRWTRLAGGPQVAAAEKKALSHHIPTTFETNGCFGGGIRKASMR